MLKGNDGVEDCGARFDWSNTGMVNANKGMPEVHAPAADGRRPVLRNSTVEQLTFPFQPPATGSSMVLADGIAWIRLPLSSKLEHINVWALEDGDGWTLVDTGIQSDETTVAWAALSEHGMLATQLQRVIVTHMHSDHIGLAGWFTRRHGARLWMTRLEYLTSRSVTSSLHRDPPIDALTFYSQAGWETPAIESTVHDSCTQVVTSMPCLTATEECETKKSS